MIDVYRQNRLIASFSTSEDFLRGLKRGMIKESDYTAPEGHPLRAMATVLALKWECLSAHVNPKSDSDFTLPIISTDLRYREEKRKKMDSYWNSL